MIHAGLSVLPRSTCASWPPEAKSPPAAVPTAEGREALLREPPEQCVTSGKLLELLRLKIIKETKKCACILSPQ